MNAKTYLHTFLLILFLPVGIIHAKEEKEIPIVLSSNHSIYMKALSGLTYSLKSKTKVYFLNTKSSSAGIFAELQKAEPEMIVTIGNQATKSVRENLPNATIVFLIVNNPRSLRMEKGRICGFSADISSGEFFKVLKKIKPEARSVSAFYSDEHGKYFSTEGKYHDIWNGLHLQIQQISDKEEMTKKLEKFTKKTESFYMVYDRLYTRETFQDLSNFCKKNQIILMTYYPSLAKIGATFALAPNYTNIGVRAGRWLNKEETDNICQQNKVFAPESSFLYLNQTYAQESGIQFSQEILKREQKERLLAYGIELYHKKKYSSAQAVFRKVLKMDPEEDTAIVFLNEIRDLRTSHEIQKLVYQAEKSRSKRNYHEAIAIYRKILSLNPDLKDFQEKLDASVYEKSEELRKKGNRLQNDKKPFAAIRAYKESISTYSSNQKAKANLSQAISQERQKLSVYMNQGKNSYKKRKYDSAIEIFSNILLIDPSNKAANGYLYNAKLKRDALKRLLECNQQNTDCSLWKK